MLNNICSEMNCDAYKEWSFYDDEYEYPCWSCKKQGQSFHITEIAVDCPYRDTVQQRLNEVKTMIMKMFCDCRGNCKDCVTHYTGGCLAGHGDDDFIRITVEQARTILSMTKTEQWRRTALLEKFPELSADNI